MTYQLNVTATSDQEFHVSSEFVCNAFRWKMRNFSSLLSSKHTNLRIALLYKLHLKISVLKKKVREKSRECHNHKPQPIQDTKRKRTDNTKQAQIDKRTKSTKISSLFPKRGNRNAKWTGKYNNKITQCKT